MIQNISSSKIYNNYSYASSPLEVYIAQIGKKVDLPNSARNYPIFNLPLVSIIVSYREQAVPEVVKVLNSAKDEKTVTESLYILDRMIEANVQGIDKLYPALSKFNSSKSANVQTLLAGIYRKTQVPDAFGPLCTMLIRNANKEDYPYFNPQEEVGGAILEYIRKASSVNYYNNYNYGIKN